MKNTVLALVVGALVVAACGGSEDSGPTDTAVAATSSTVPTTQAPQTTTTTTVVPTTTTATPSIVPGEDADVDAIVLAYTVAFDSLSDYEVKAPHIDDPTGLEETVDAYLATGETMGGVGVVVTDVVVNGADANVTYDLLFNNNPTYPDLPGTAVLTDVGWQVPRTVFSALMSSARVGCPAE